MQPTIAKREAQRYAGIRKVLRRDEVPEVVPACLATVFAFLRKQRVAVIGAPLIRYLLVDYNTGGIEVDVGCRSA